MDPVTLLAAATAAYNGVKKAVEMGQEIQGIYSQLSTWAGHAGDLKDAIEGIENRKPGLWDKISFDKSETAEAFDLYAAKQKLKEMEEEIFHMFMYGDLCHLGLDGYREFKQMRTEIREKRKKMIIDQLKARKDFIHNVVVWSSVALISVVSISLIWWMISLINEAGKAAGKW